MKYFDLCALSNDNEILLVGLTVTSKFVTLKVSESIL